MCSEDSHGEVVAKVGGLWPPPPGLEGPGDRSSEPHLDLRLLASRLWENDFLLL